MYKIKRIFDWKFFYLVFFSIISVLVLWELLLPKYIFTLDMVFTPTINNINIIYGFDLYYVINLPFRLALQAVNILMPFWLIQKIILFLAFFLSGVSAYRLCPTNRYGKYFAGLIYMLNPLVFVRFLVGHWLFLLSYAILPFAIKIFFDMFERPNKKNIIRAAFSITLIAILDVHNLFLILVIFAIIFLFRLYRQKSKLQIFTLFKSLIILLIILFALNLFWVLPLFTAEQIPSEEIGREDIFLMQPIKVFDNLPFTFISMLGFWRAGYNYSMLYIPFWYLIPVFILLLMLYGYFISNSQHKDEFLVMAILSIVFAVFMSIGTTHPYTKSFVLQIFNVFPTLFQIFRDVQKFLPLLIITYSFLGGIAVGRLIKSPRKIFNYNFIGEEKIDSIKILSVLVAVIALAVPFIYSYTMFFGFEGYMRSTDYPNDWYELNDYLNEDNDDFNVLFLPWHMYMDFQWLPNWDKRIFNPAKDFFTKPVIQGDNLELGNVYSASKNPISPYIESLLDNRNNITNFGERIMPLNVKYVVLTKESDYGGYAFLFNQSDLEMINATEHFLVFKNKNPISKIYQTDDLDQINDWERLDHTRISVVEYIIEEPRKKFIVFTERYSNYWRLGANNPFERFGVNIFTYNGQILQNIRFRTHIIGYIVSVVTLLVLLFFYKKQKG
ncbi:MAG: hypothetical protein ISS36_03675 [Candidatus Aenigmarchaeota archaeon]|nr:hypothetical protein [Candidatus Aenigmarchaeota archaeon]